MNKSCQFYWLVVHSASILYTLYPLLFSALYTNNLLHILFHGFLIACKSFALVSSIEFNFFCYNYGHLLQTVLFGKTKNKQFLGHPDTVSKYLPVLLVMNVISFAASGMLLLFAISFLFPCLFDTPIHSIILQTVCASLSFRLFVTSECLLLMGACVPGCSLMLSLCFVAIMELISKTSRIW